MRLFLGWLVAALALVTAAAPARATWHEARSKHFIIYGDVDAAELRDYATKLERFDGAVRNARMMQDPPLTDSGRLTIYLLRDADALARLAGWGTYGQYIARASGSYAFVAKNKGKGDWDLNSDIIFFHEYAHHLMLQNLTAALPQWFVEGFAEFLATARMNDDGSVTLGAPANHRAAGVFAFHRDMLLSEILAGKYKHLTGWQQELVYARGWLLTHYLTFDPSRRGQLDHYVAAIQKGSDSLQAAKAAFGDLRRLDSELRRYAARRQLTGIVVHPDPSKLGPISVRPLGAAEAAIMPVRIRLDHGVSRRTARPVAAQARKIAAAHLNDPFVQATLAEAEYDAENYAASIAAAERAISAHPSNTRALMCKGRALMEIANQQPAKVDWAAVRGWFTRANRVDPEDPEPLMLFYQTFVAAGVGPTANAAKGLLYALVLAPQDEDLRMMAVRQLLADGRLTEAKREFGPLAFDPHVGDFRKTADKILEAIDSGNTAAALAQIDAWRRAQRKKG